MDWIQILAAAGTILGSIITIVGANFTLLKFLLKDMHKEMVDLRKKQEKYEDRFETEMRHTNNRLDGLYRVILDRTYGKNIPEELK